MGIKLGHCAKARPLRRPATLIWMLRADEALHARPAGAIPRFRGAGADAAVRGRPQQVRVRMVQINLRALLQLGVMAIILYQVRQARHHVL